MFLFGYFVVDSHMVAGHCFGRMEVENSDHMVKSIVLGY